MINSQNQQAANGIYWQNAVTNKCFQPRYFSKMKMQNLLREIWKIKKVIKVILNSKHIHSTTKKYAKLLEFIGKSIFGIHNCPVASQDFYRVLADVQTFLHYLKNFLIHLRIYPPPPSMIPSWLGPEAAKQAQMMTYFSAYFKV